MGSYPYSDGETFTAANANEVYEQGADAQTDVAAHGVDPTDAHDASAISFVPTGSIAATNVQAAIAEVASEAVGGTGGGSLGANVIDVTDYGSVAAAVAALADGDTLYFPPSPTNYTTSTLLVIPDGVNISGYGAALVCQTSGSGIHIPNPHGHFRGLYISGNDVATNPLTLGSPSTWTGSAWNWGDGSKSHFADLQVQKVGTGGTAIRNYHLQNCIFTNIRITNSPLATCGLLIDEGSKNCHYFGLWSSVINGPAIKITTSSGDQRTSKHTFYGGLSEGSDALNATTFGVRLEDCEQITFHNFAMNGAFDDTSVSAYTFDFGGNRDTNNDGVGNGGKGPADVTIDGGQVQIFTNAFDVRVNMDLHVGGLEVGADNLYKMENGNARIYETRPHHSEPASRYVSYGGHSQHNAIIPARPFTLTYEIGTETTTVTATTMKTFRWPFAGVITKATAALTTASSSGNPTVDLRADAVSVFGTNKLRIDANEKTSETAAVAVSVPTGTIAADAEMTIVGTVAGTGAAGLKVTLQGYRT
jgi:hypothetical protein